MVAVLVSLSAVTDFQCPGDNLAPANLHTSIVNYDEQTFLYILHQTRLFSYSTIT
jgi:hypothetical protein